MSRSKSKNWYFSIIIPAQKDEDIKLMLTTKKDISSLNEEVLALKRERAKYEELILKQKRENDKIA